MLYDLCTYMLKASVLRIPSVQPFSKTFVFLNKYIFYYILLRNPNNDPAVRAVCYILCVWAVLTDEAKFVFSHHHAAYCDKLTANLKAVTVNSSVFFRNFIKMT